MLIAKWWLCRLSKHPQKRQKGIGQTGGKLQSKLTKTKRIPLAILLKPRSRKKSDVARKKNRLKVMIAKTIRISFRMGKKSKKSLNKVISRLPIKCQMNPLNPILMKNRKKSQANFRKFWIAEKKTKTHEMMVQSFRRPPMLSLTICWN